MLCTMYSQNVAIALVLPSLDVTGVLSICYSRQELLDIRNSSLRMDSGPLRKTVCGYGLLKKLRGRKAGCKHPLNCVTTCKSALITIPRISSSNTRLNLKCALWNARSLSGKVAALSTHLLDNKIDVFVITETWLREETDHIISEFVSGYTFYHRPRRGGGVAIITRSNLTVKSNRTSTYKSFEHTCMDITIRSLAEQVRIIAIYRPPSSSSKIKCTKKTNDFVLEFCKLLETVIAKPGHLLILGDFNFHYDNLLSPDRGKLSDLLESMNLVQHVTSPTHEKGHKCDLSRQNERKVAWCGFSVWLVKVKN